MIWTDIPATQLRREIRQHLRRHQTRIQSNHLDTQRLQLAPAYLTRSQRAHRRLSWAERLKRNAILSQEMQVCVQLFGIDPRRVEFLNSLPDKRSDTL